MSVLALDLGRLTGWAVSCNGIILHGTWELETKEDVAAMRRARTERDFDPRFNRLWDALVCVFDECAKKNDILTDIWFEDVEFGSYVLQMQQWSGYRAVTMVFSRLCSPSVLTHAIPVGTLKQFATGSGKAKKHHMALALKKVGMWRAGMDDNCVDAVHLLRLALNK